jgi:Papain-like cysteine protease AvrRpt2
LANLNFDIQKQEKTQWCWAAVTSSICGFYQDTNAPTQCALANQFLGAGEDCCQTDASDLCDVSFPVDIALNSLGHMVQPTLGVVSFEDLNSEITENQRPVVARITFSDFPASHFVVVIGCGINANGAQMLKIADPSVAVGNFASIEYSAFKNNYKPSATWDRTYFTK